MKRAHAIRMHNIGIAFHSRAMGKKSIRILFALPMKKVCWAIWCEADLDMSENPLQGRHYLVFIKRLRYCLGEWDFVYAVKQPLKSDKYLPGARFANTD